MIRRMIGIFLPWPEWEWSLMFLKKSASIFKAVTTTGSAISTPVPLKRNIDRSVRLPDYRSSVRTNAELNRTLPAGDFFKRFFLRVFRFDPVGLWRTLLSF